MIAGLDKLLVDFDAWRSRIESGHDTERARLTGEVDRAQRDRDVQANKTTKVEAPWVKYVGAGDDDEANVVLPIIERERQLALEAERRRRAANDALASVPADAPADAMLDFANALQAAVSGRLDQTGTMAEVNQALRELFACFEVREDTGDGHSTAS